MNAVLHRNGSAWYASVVSEKSGAGFDILTRAHRRSLEALFLCPQSKFYGGPCMGSSERRALAGMSTCTVRHPLLDIDGGVSRIRPEGIAMSKSIPAHLAHQSKEIQSIVVNLRWLSSAVDDQSYALYGIQCPSRARAALRQISNELEQTARVLSEIGSASWIDL